MIVINKLEFENIFSYGDNNSIEFDTDTVIQLLGKNGAGKSSIPTILEEALYNKNSRGVKKADICNRNTASPVYSISVFFTVDGDAYELHKVVKSTTKLTLLKNGKDVSGHTTTQTYKKIELEILRLDFTTFTKLVYQSMVSSLDFLKATDTARKNFLIGLLGLESYSAAEQAIKQANKEAKILLAESKASTSVIQSWIDKHGSVGSLKEELPEVPYDPSKDAVLDALKANKATLDKDNKDAKENLEAFEKLERLKKEEPEAGTDRAEELRLATKDKDIKLGEIKSANAEVLKLGAVKDKCPMCGSTLDITDTKEMLSAAKAAKEILDKELDPLIERVTYLTGVQNKYTTYKKWKTEISAAESKYNSDRPTTVNSVESINAEISTLQTEIKNLKDSIKKTQEYNKTVAIHNSRVKSNMEKLEQYKTEVSEKEKELKVIKEVAADLEVLTEALGTKGLIQYKIESMIKVFEKLINEYLSKISDGKFVLTFIIADTKLSLNLYDDGKKIDIKSLSSGEFAKVNTATLLAVRKMMSSVSKVNINLVIFDEVISVLDEHGKEILVSILLEENDLNSVLVSHGYNHPLSRVIEIKKKGGISCIIY